MLARDVGKELAEAIKYLFQTTKISLCYPQLSNR